MAQARGQPSQRVSALLIHAVYLTRSAQRQPLPGSTPWKPPLVRSGTDSNRSSYLGANT